MRKLAGVVSSVVFGMATACTVTRSVDQEKLLQTVREMGAKVGDLRGVTCPQMEGTLGAKVTCKLEFAEGPTREAVVTLDDLANAHITVVPTPGLVDRVELIAKIKERSQGKVTELRCPGNQASGDAFVCTATTAEGEVPLDVKTTAAGGVEWKVR